MRVGIVGLPNAGKSTLFNILTGANAETDIYPFTTVERNVGRVAVPDERLEPLAEAIGSEETVPTSVQVVDIAGLVPGASRGEGLGNRFLGHIREVDAVAHVIRAFQSDEVTSPQEGLDPIRDLQQVQKELVLADLQSVDKKVQQVSREAKSQAPEALERLEHLKQLRKRLDSGQYLHQCWQQLSDGESRQAEQLHLLTMRPVLYVLNVSEEDYGEGGRIWRKRLAEHLQEQPSDILIISARFEEELAAFDSQERQMFLQDAGVDEWGRSRFLRSAHQLLGLLTFFTGNQRQTQAWSLTRGGTALDAAGKIHTDMAEGFIRAEVIQADVLIGMGSRRLARERGLTRIVGKEYLMREGDVIEVRFRS